MTTNGILDLINILLALFIIYTSSKTMYKDLTKEIWKQTDKYLFNNLKEKEPGTLLVMVILPSFTVIQCCTSTPIIKINPMLGYLYLTLSLLHGILIAIYLGSIYYLNFTAKK